MWLADARRVSCPPVGLERLLEIAARILREGSVREPVVVDGSMAAVGRADLCSAMKEMGFALLPVTRDPGERLERPLALEELGFYDEVRPKADRVFEDAAELLRRNWPTPLVRLRRSPAKGLRVWAKLEWYNPFSCSIKDRIAWYMLERAASSGTGFSAVYEASSTNTGLALAALARLRGLSAKIFLPSTAQQCVDLIFKIYGAEVSRPGASLTTELIGRVREEAERAGALFLNQFENDANFLVHLRYTAKELDYQARSRGLEVSAIASGLGTSGHLSALSFYFKSRLGERVAAVAAQPSPRDFIPGLRRVETGMKWLGVAKLDKIYDVTLEEALKEVVEVARSDGLLIGLSAGAAMAALSRAFEDGLVSGGDAVVVVPDHGMKYVEILSKCADLI